MPLILLIEDNPLTRRLVRAAAERAGFTLLEAATGVAALEMLEGHRPDIILQELTLKDRGGIDLLRDLRAHPATAHAPILALTGLVSKEEEARISSAGFDGLVTKPIEPARLSRALSSHIAARPAERAPFGAGKRILLADDDPQQLKLVRFRLSKLGFEVETAADGLEALELARRRAPDVIVSDALMPRLDGFGLCLAIRNDPKLASVPVVLATASYLEAEDRHLARQAGATDFVVRTSDLADVVRAVERAVSRTTSSSSADAPESNVVESARAVRAARQLDRQVQANSSLLQRCSTLAAELAVLSTVAEALVDARGVEAALLEILDNCLDAAGASAGAVYRRAPDGKLSLLASHGITTTEAHADASPELLDRIASTAAATPLTTLVGPEGKLPLGLGAGALAIPLFTRHQDFGVLLVDSAPEGATTEDRSAFAEAIARQLGLALSLTDAFRKVEASDARTRALMDNAEDAIFVTTERGAVLEANQAGERLLGLRETDIIGRDLMSFMRDTGAHASANAALPRKGVTTGAAAIERANGVMVPVEYSSSRVSMGDQTICMSIVRDVSSRLAMAEQLRQSQKMDAIGRLAGGIAHDFNNLLSVVLTYCHYLVDDFELGDPRREDIEEIRRAGERAAQLTHQLLAFSRQQVLQTELVSLNDVIQGLEKMVARVIGENIQVSVDLAPDLGKVRADVGQLHQVLLNLTVNARDAMPSGGKLTFVTKNVDGSDDPSLREGRYVAVYVSDTGSGMDETTLARIFEPFFTTKGPGKGTGLGLATVFGIVDQSGGLVRVDSKVEVGSTFRIYLPQSNEEATVSPSSPVPLSQSRGSETILLVEDEAAVRVVVQNVLQRSGYRVLAASSPGDALLVAEQHDGALDLLLSDLVMPHMSGPALAERLIATRPTLKVLLMSGHADADSFPFETLRPDVGFLQKPLTPNAILKKVREALEGPRRDRMSDAAPMVTTFPRPR